MRHYTKNDKIYASWQRMHVRCYDTSYHSFHRYGGRGIKVCERWHDYKNFKFDMESTWFPEATLDREDNNGNYNRDNCSWKTKSDNRKPYKEYDFEEMIALHKSGMPQWKIAELFGIDQPRVSRLLKRVLSNGTDI